MQLSPNDFPGSVDHVDPSSVEPLEADGQDDGISIEDLVTQVRLAAFQIAGCRRLRCSCTGHNSRVNCWL